MIKLLQFLKKPTSGTDKKALRYFVQNIYWGKDLTPETAKRNLEKGLIEIVHRGRHIANGLLMTKSGFFVTSQHCLSGSVRGIKIRASNGKLFGIDFICLSDKEKDIALAKAKIPGAEEPMKYKYFDVTETKSTPMVLMTRRGGKIIIKGGHTYGQSVSLGTNGGVLLLQEIASEPGDSGGAITSVDGRLIGIHNSKLRGEKYIGFYTAWHDVLKLISLFSEQ